jgi:hypothetical protein
MFSKEQTASVKVATNRRRLIARMASPILSLIILAASPMAVLIIHFGLVPSVRPVIGKYIMASTAMLRTKSFKKSFKKSFDYKNWNNVDERLGA